MCPYARFQDDLAPTCRLTAEGLFFQAGELLPSIVVASPTSVRPVAKYVVSLVKRGLGVADVITTLGLERATSRGGILFARLTCTMTGTLAPAQRTRMREIITLLGLGSPAVITTATAAVPRDHVAPAPLDLPVGEDEPPPASVKPEDDDIPF
jgi:hypothetical protein